MNREGWTVNIFNNVNYVSGDLANEYGLISNIAKVEGKQEYSINPAVFRKLVKLSFFRYFPLIMKAPFWLYTEELNQMKVLSEYEQGWDRIKSLQKYLDQRLTVDPEKKVYVSYHWAGAHEPFYVDEFAKPLVSSNGATAMEAQLAGHFYIIQQYIQQMKDYHIYDDTAIIITTDHGDYTYPHSILFIKPAGQRQDEMTFSHAPVSQSDFLETIAEMAGLEKGQFGRSFYDIGEEEERYRCSLILGKEYCYYGDKKEVNRMIQKGEYTDAFDHEIMPE